MADVKTPDLRRFVCLLGMAAHKVWPDVVKPTDVDRLRDAENVLLVLTRVLGNIAIRAGMSKDAVIQVAEEAKRPIVPDDPFEVKPLMDGTITGRTDDWQVIEEVDKALYDPAVRSKMPVWFVNDYWPHVMRRAVNNKGRLRDRDRDVARYVTSVARGER